MEIRSATLNDMPGIEALLAASYAEQASLGVPDFTVMHGRAIEAAIEAGLGGVYVAEDSDVIVGFTAMLHFPLMPREYAEGITTYVIPDERRTKVAHDLGMAAKAFHKEQGRSFFIGTVYLGNKASISRCFAEGAELVGLVLRYSLEDK